MKKQYIIANGIVYEVESVVVFSTSREEFIKAAENTPKTEGKKIFAYGTVNGQVVQQIVYTKEVGTVYPMGILNNKHEKNKV